MTRYHFHSRKREASLSSLTQVCDAVRSAVSNFPAEHLSEILPLVSQLLCNALFTNPTAGCALAKTAVLVCFVFIFTFSVKGDKEWFSLHSSVELRLFLFFVCFEIETSSIGIRTQLINCIPVMFMYSALVRFFCT